MVSPRKPSDCYVKYGIAHAIDGKGETLDKAVEMIKKLDSAKTTNEYKGSADDFLIDFVIGYMDAMRVKISPEREIERLPAICTNTCTSQDYCYFKTNTGYKKRLL